MPAIKFTVYMLTMIQVQKNKYSMSLVNDVSKLEVVNWMVLWTTSWWRAVLFINYLWSRSFYNNKGLSTISAHCQGGNEMSKSRLGIKHQRKRLFKVNNILLLSKSDHSGVGRERKNSLFSWMLSTAKTRSVIYNNWLVNFNTLYEKSQTISMGHL